MANYDPYDDLIRDIEKRESGGRDYDASGRLLTSPKGAQGRMQVMPFTSADPGFGVTPAKDNSKEELARVGQDYARAMLDRYGDKKLAMMAYNWGPGSVDKWLAAGADPKAVPRETRRYVQDVQDNQGGFMKVGQRGGSSEAKLQQYTVELPSGKRYTVEGYSPDDAYRLAEEFDAQNKPAKGGALSDIVKSLKSGAYGLAQLPSNIYGIATGDYDQLGGEYLRGKQKEIQESMSPEYLAQRQAAQQAISEAEKEGELAGGLEALKQYVTSPRLLANLAAESAPSMVGSLGVGKLAQMGAAGLAKKGLQAAASEEAAKAAAARAATLGSRTSMGTMATMQGGDVAQQTYQAVYDEAIKQGYTEAHARDVAGIEARKAGLEGGAVSLATMGLLPGVEKGFFKGVGGKSFAGGLARGFAGEATQEALEEGGGRIAQNLGVQAVNPEQSAMQGVGSTMAQAGLAGGLFGGPIGGLHTRAEVQQKAQEEAAAAQRKRFEEQAAIRAEQQRVEAERNAKIEARTAAQNEDLLAGREAAVSSTADEFISKLDTVDGINELLQNPRQWLRDDVSKEDVNKFRNDLKQMREALKEKQKREAELSSQSAFNQPVETTTPPPATDTALAQGASEAVASKLDEFNEKAKTVEGVNDLLKNLKSWFPTANRDELTGFKSTLEKMRSDLQATQAADAKKAKQSAFAAAEVDAQGNVIVPPETQITPEKLKSWGVNRGSNLYKALLGKDIANPEDFAFTRTALEAAASTTKAEGFATKLENVLNTELAPKEEKSPVQEQAGVQTEEQAAPVQSTEVVDEAALEEQRAQEEHNKLRFLDMQNRLRTPAEREQMAAEERARREEGFAAAEEEKRRQEEAMFAQQEQENADYAEKGTQFPLHSFGAQPQTQENVAPELDQLLTEYLDARERVNSDPNAEYEMQDIEALARETYGGRRWASAKYEAVKRRQGQLDFEGKQRAEEEPRGEAAVGGQERGVGRKSGEPSVGLATQPQEQPAAEVAQAPAARGVGPTERVPAQRDEGKKREQRALEVDPVQLVSDLQEISDREKNNDIGKRARTYLREAQQGNAKDMAPAAAFAEEHKAPAKEAPKVEKTADELEADLADALAEGNEKRAAAIEAKLSKIGKKPIAKEEVEAAAEVADETRTRKYSGDKEAFEGSTVDRLMAAVKQLFNNPTQLNRKLSIVQSVNDLPADIRADFEASEKKGVIQRAVYDGETDRVYLVADRVPANMALGIILHENGVHQGMRTLLGPQLHSQLISQINQWAKTGTGIEGEIARRAQARVEAAGKANVQENDEILAYFTEIANQEYGIDPTAIKGSTPLANWFRKLWAAVKMAINKMGINPEKVSAQDVIDLAYGAAKLELNEAPKAVSETTQEKPTERKFSGYAPADAIMERAGGRMPTEEDTSLSATLNNIKSNYTSVGDLSTKLYDKVMGALSKEYAFEEGHRRRIEAVFGKNAEAAKEFAKLGLIAQAGHIPAVADVAMEKGGIAYDPNTFMFKATESDANFANIQNQLVDLAKKYGVSYDTMRMYNNNAMQARRMDGLYKTRDEMLRQAAYLEQSNKPAERKKAKELRDKYENMPFHLKREQVREFLNLYDVIPELADIERQKNDIRSWVARFMVDSGFWTQEHANDMLDIADWVPFNREFDESEQYDLNKFKQYAHGLQANFKEYGYKGSNRAVADVLDNFERWVHSALTRSVRNKATAELLKDAVKYGGADYVQSSSKTQTSSTAHFYEDGKIKYVRFDNPLEAAFFTSGVATPPVSKLNQFFNKIFRESIIAAPTFSIAQLVKDPVDAMVRSGLPPQHAIKIQGYALAEMASLLKGEKTEAFKALQERGLAGAAADLATLRRDELKNLIGYKAVQTHKDGKLLNVLTRLRDKGLKMSMFADNAVRQAVYRAALESGETEATALKLAADTINFRRQLGSDSLASLASHIPFFGASLAAVRASLTVLGGRGSNTTKAEARKRLVQNLAMLATIKVLFSMASGDDDEYKRMSPLQRARQLTLPGMGGFGIPMRVSLESLPAILAELTYNQLTDNASDPAAARKAIAGLIIDAVNPVSAPLSAPVKTAIEQVTDYNFFTGSPIVGERLKKQEAYLQYGEGTSEFAKLMGSVANQLGFSNAISPKRVDHLIHGLLGVTGSSALLASNIVAGEMGVREPMSAKEIAASIPGLTMPGAKEFNNEERNLFYDWANKVQTVTETLRHLKQEGRAEEYVAYVEEHRDLLKYQKMVEQVEKQLSKIRNTISVVRASNAPAEEKEQRIRELKEIEQRYIKNLDIKKLRSETM